MKHITLTQEQEKLIRDAFFDEQNVPSISELVKLAFPTIENGDGRSKEGKAIMAFLATQGLKPLTTTTYQAKPKIELTDEQKEYIKNNLNKVSLVEMAKTLFNNPNLSNLNIETRTIIEYAKTLDEPSEEADSIPTSQYRSPRTIEGVLRRIDKCVFNHDMNKDALSAYNRSCLTALLSYMNTLRFYYQINLYNSNNNRDLFESAFIRYTYDKPDLTEEEVDQYIMLSHESVESGNIQRRKERLQILLENQTQEGEENVRISMGLVEAIGKLQDEYNQCVNRQQKLLGDLKQKRSARIAEKNNANASIINLIQLWQEEKTRKKMLYLAEARKREVSKVIDELSTMEEFKCRIMGINPDRILNGDM